MGDDAYIGFRTVDNVIHGHVLRCNTFERVQAFTNPVWTLLMCAASMVTREVFFTFFTGLALQIAISVATIRLVARSSRSALVGCGIVVALTLCKAFVDYSTSGLENPVSHLLVALFVVRYLSDDDLSPRALRRLMLIASLGLVNRLDLALLLGPCVIERAASAWRRASRPADRRAAVRALAVGAAPLFS